MHTFSATVSSRSSRQPGGPPGEAEVLALNPQRRDRILQTTRWAALFPGSLNLEVATECVHRLLLYSPAIREDGENVRYPTAHAHVPKMRVGYLYFLGRLRKGDKVTPVLIRRAVNPLPNRIEAFAEQSLREALSLSDGDIVSCEVDDSAV
jgi:CTP-dependent riboflavin kinase